MPVVGTREAEVRSIGSQRKNRLYKFAKSFAETAASIKDVQRFDVAKNPIEVYTNPTTKSTMKNFFVNESFDPGDEFLDAEDRLDIQEMMGALYDNDVSAMTEAAAPASCNPVVGMTLPLHKNIMMNMIFDKGGIQKVVSKSRTFSETMEVRYLVTPSGELIDMYRQQNQMTAEIDKSLPVQMFEMSLPADEGATDIIGSLGGGALDSLDIAETYIAAILVPGVYYKVGELLPDEQGYISDASVPAVAAGAGVDPKLAAGVHDTWVHTQIYMTATFSQNPYGDGMQERQVIHGFTYTFKSDENGTPVTLSGKIAATMNGGKIGVYDLLGKITKVRMAARLDSSNAMVNACSTTWKAFSKNIEIGTAVPFNTTISPEELKDYAALYDVNQVTKYMSMFKTVMSNYKDDKIRQKLDISWNSMPTTSKAVVPFNMKPRMDYAFDPATWRHSFFMEIFDRLVTKLLQNLNDPNVSVTVYGDPDTIRRIKPTKYDYASPKDIGAVTLDYSKTVWTDDQRTYQFLGSDKLRGSNELIVLLKPENTDRIIYRIYDYQLYMSNEIRNAANPTLPAIHAFERWKFFEWQPVQGRVKLINNGIDDIANLF